MFAAFYLKTEDFTPDELNSLAGYAGLEDGGVWLSTGINGETEQEVLDQLNHEQGYHGKGNKIEIRWID